MTLKRRSAVAGMVFSLSIGFCRPREMRDCCAEAHAGFADLLRQKG